MSSLTKVQFRDRLKNRSTIVSGLADSIIEEFIDTALEAYSERRPKYKVSLNNTVVDDVDLYNFPTDALHVRKIVESTTRAEVRFGTEDSAGTNQIRLGKVIQPSTTALSALGYYQNPIFSEAAPALSITPDSFDVEYTLLQDMATVPDTALRALACFVESLSADEKLAQVINSTASTGAADQTTVQDPSGASLSISNSSSSGSGISALLSSLRTLRKDKMDEFDALVGAGGYAVRG